jgi:hypothetical protein
MKRSLFLLTLFTCSLLIHANDIDRHAAKKAAISFYYERINMVSAADHSSIRVSEVHEITHEGQVMMYAVNIEERGFVIVSASRLVRPVLGFSFYGSYTAEALPPQLSELLTLYGLQISETIGAGKQAEPGTVNAWKRLLSDDIPPAHLSPEVKNVEPMLHTTWNQGTPYNELCPPDPAGPGGHCYAGCVATALGQVVNYFRWPLTGTGEYSYECPPYGTLYANFGNTSYEWDKMPTILKRSNLPVALLLNHLGIACDMVYGPNGSGMYNHKAAYALRTFFKYSPETVYVYRDSTSMDWDSLLVSHLDRNIPMYYAGWSVPNINGHAFVCDGYQEDKQGIMYHFNWGWGGSSDGYFYTDDLTPGGSNFNLAQEVIINAYPDTVNYDYPYYCQGGKVLGVLDGTIDDGSGPLWDYATDASCSWLISYTDSIENITLEFLEFETEKGDILTVYDGEDDTAPVLGTYEGSDIPDNVNSSGDRLYLAFETDGSGTAPGWLLEYKQNLPVYCSGLAMMEEQTGTITDGSGPGDYHNGTLCLWMIAPPGAGEVRLYFDSFHTEETYDYLQVFDASGTEIARLSGDTMPPPIVTSSGKMSLKFSTNSSVTAPGWEAWYETDLVMVNEYSIEQHLEVYPNPASQHVYVSWESEEIKQVNLRITDMSGREYRGFITNSVPGMNSFRLDLEGLQKGLYLLLVTSGNETSVQKLLIADEH